MNIRNLKSELNFIICQLNPNKLVFFLAAILEIIWNLIENTEHKLNCNIYNHIGEFFKISYKLILLTFPNAHEIGGLGNGYG